MESDKASASGSETTSPTKVVICLPGVEFSHRFMVCVTSLLLEMSRSEKYSLVSINYGPSHNIDLARVICFTRRHMDTRPLEDIDYDVLVSIDHDVLFEASQVMKIIDACNESHPVVVGAYRVGTSDFSNVVKESETLSMKTISMNTVTGWAEDHPEDPFMPISHAALGFFAARKQALDTLEYPYVDHPPVTVKNADGKEVREMLTGDVVLSLKLKEKGFPLALHTGIIVSHELKVAV